MPENPAVFINRANPSIIRVECSSMLLSITAWHKVIITSQLRLRQQFKCIVSLSFRSEKGSVKSDAEQTRNKNETKIITRKKLGHASVSNILNTYQRFSQLQRAYHDIFSSPVFNENRFFGSLGQSELNNCKNSKDSLVARTVSILAPFSFQPHFSMTG